MKFYALYLHYLKRLAGSSWVSVPLLWWICLCNAGWIGWMLLTAARGITLVPSLLLLCWCLMLLFVRYSFVWDAPIPVGRAWTDRWRQAWYKIKLHSMALLVLLLALVTLFTSLKMLSLLLKHGPWL